MDAEFILVYNDSKISKKYCVLAEKWQFFQRVLKMGDFGQNAKGGPFANDSRFLGWTSQASKNRKYLSDFSLIWMDAEFILVYNDTKKKYCVLAEKWQFFQRVLKMGDFGQNAKGGPFAKFSKSAVFWAELRKLQKIGNTCRILA